MAVPNSVLSKLNCSNCAGYLSRGPVYILDDGNIKCVRCIKPEDGTHRIKSFDEEANLMVFPCHHAKNGCQEKVSFANIQIHEQACAYRNYICPISKTILCGWSDTCETILAHCLAHHPHNVTKNPLTLVHTINKSHFDNYVISAFHLLFLIQSKVCLSSRKIYHSVQLIGDPSVAHKYTFVVDIENKTSKLTKQGNVIPQAFQVLDTDTSVVVRINNILEELGDFEDTIFMVTIRSTNQGDKEAPIRARTGVERKKKKNKNIGVQVNSINSNLFTGLMYQDAKAKGSLARRMCKYSSMGCTHVDLVENCRKHESQCQYNNECHICMKNITNMCLTVHYTQVHRYIKHRAGIEFSVTPRIHLKQWFIITADFGHVLFKYWMQDVNFHLLVYTPSLCEEMYKYKFNIEIRHPSLRIPIASTDDIHYNSNYHFYIPFYQYTLSENIYIKIDYINLEKPVTKK